MLKNCFKILLLIFISANLNAQDAQVILDQQMNLAREQMKEGNYESANKTFRKILTLKIVLPHEFTYLFAETLYMVGQYENSKNFLDRYIKLTGKAGNFTQQAEELMVLLDSKKIDIKECSFCDIRGYRLQECTRCNGVKIISEQCHHCLGNGKLKCHVCLGERVLIEKNEFSIDEYQTCYKCNGTGIEVCPVCKGEKVLFNSCPVCLGSGKEGTTAICDHTAPEDPSHD